MKSNRTIFGLTLIALGLATCPVQAQVGLTKDQRKAVFSRDTLVGSHLGDALLVVVRMDLPEPVVETMQSGGLLAKVRSHLVSRLAGTASIRAYMHRPIVLRVVTDSASHVILKLPKHSGPLTPVPLKLEGGGSDPRLHLTPDTILASPRDPKATYELTMGEGTGFRQVTLNVLEPDPVDFSSSFGAFAVASPGSRPAFGIRKPTFSLGRSSRLTIDLVTLFAGGEDLALGSALSYTMQMGSGYESSRGIFGFPMRATFTLGFAGLDAKRPDRSGRMFFGFGFEIPTGSGG